MSKNPDHFDAVYATLSSRPVTTEAVRLVDSLLVMLTDYERGKGQRKNKRGKQLDKLRTALGSFLGDLLGALDDRKAEGWTYRSMKTETFSGEDVSFRMFSAVVKGLGALGYLEHQLGKKYWVGSKFDGPMGEPAENGGIASQFHATKPLVDLALSFGITSKAAHEHFGASPPTHPLVLKTCSTGVGRYKISPKRMLFSATQQTEALEAEIKKLNAFLAEFPIENGAHWGYRRVFNEGDKNDPYNWDKGGRVYSLGNYQRKSKEDRLAMRLDGSPVAEIDVTASYLTILHGLERMEFDTQADPYEVGLPRDVVKLWTVATLGYSKHFKKWPPSLSADYLQDHGHKISSVARIGEVKELMVAKHRVLADWGSGLTWADLQYAESNAMLGAMIDLMRVGKPSLSVHDSLVVRHEDESDACEALSRNYQVVCGISPSLKVSHPDASGTH